MPDVHKQAHFSSEGWGRCGCEQPTKSIVGIVAKMRDKIEAISDFISEIWVGRRDSSRSLCR